MVNFETSPPEKFPFSMDPAKIFEELRDSRIKKTNYSHEMMGNVSIGGAEYRLRLGLNKSGAVHGISLAGEIKNDTYREISLSGTLDNVSNRLSSVVPDIVGTKYTVADPAGLCWIYFEHDEATGIGWWNPRFFSVEEFLSGIA